MISPELILLIEEMVKPPDGGNGIIPCLVFSGLGVLPVGSYLSTGQVASSLTGALVPGKSKIIKVSASSNANVGSTTRIQFQRRSAVNTRVDITGAYVDISSGDYRGKTEGLDIEIGADWELAAYIASGAALTSPVAVIFLQRV